MVDIKDIQGNILLSTPISEGSKRKFTLQKEDYIALKFSVDDPIYFKLGDGIDDDNIGLFELVDLYKPTYNESTGGYDYELQLDAYYWKWKNKIFKFTPESGGQEAAWNLTASLDVHLGIFLRNLKSLSYTYRGIAFEFSIDSTVENSSKLVSYDSTNMIDALTKMAETWECEWWITDNIIHFGRCEFGDPVDFEIDVNVKSMPRSDSQTNYATRIYAFGSTRNISTNYRTVDENIVVNGVVQKRLMLPVGTPYIDAYEDMSEEEAVEDIVIFDDIYPRRIGTASAITIKEYTDTIENEDGTKTPEKWNAYRFKDAGITFSKSYIITGQELRIKFESGLLNGMEFGVTFNPDGAAEKLSNGLWNPKAQLWEIVRNDDYGRNLPDETLKPVAGDTYVLSGFDTSLVSDQYLPAAEQELKEKAQAYVEKTKKDPSTYSCTMSSVYMHNDGESRIFEIGDRVNLINKGYFENGRMSRIIGFEYYLDKPCDSTIYTVGETAAYSRIGEIENKIDSVTYKGQTYTGGSGSGVYVIRTNDNTIASNSNVLSALRSLSTFLRKDSDDEAAGLITFLKGLNLGQFVTGATGGNLDAAGNAELNSLIIRLKAEVQSLNVTDSAKIKTLEVLELLKGKVITGTLISGDEVKATLIEAIQIIGDNIIANETVAGKNVTASEKVTGKSLVAKEDISGVTADILDKATTLNLLVKNLAEIYDLKVSHVATLMGTIVKEYISSESFVSGFAGEGMKIYKALNGDWNMEIDNLTVRKIFSVFELVVQRITHQGGMVIRSAAGGKLTKVTDGGTYWRCEHDSTDDFALNDQIICQAFTGVQAKRYWRLVTSAGAGYFNLSKADCEAGSNNPEAGDEVAVLGNRTNTARQKAQIDCAVGDNAPYRDDYDNINSYSLVGKLITRTGNLSGITDAVFGVLSGSGLYGTNVYLRGVFRLLSGKTVEEAITDAQVLAQEYSDNKLTTFKTTTYQSDIQAMQESISLKVSSTTYQQDQSLVTTRLSAAEAKITDEAIRLTVKSQTETIAKSAVDNLQIGGRNLYLNSEPEKVYDREYTFYDIVEIVKANLGNILTYSMDVKVPIDGNVDVYSLGNYNIGIYKGFTLVANTWTRISVTGVCRYDEGASSQDFCNLSIYGAYGSGRIPTVRRLKIEHGNKATDWTAAPEDDAQAATDKANQAKQDAIADAVGKYTTKTEHASSITQLSNSIELKVSQTDFNALGNRVTAAESSIILLPSQIQSAVSESKTYTDNTVGNIKIGGTNLCVNTGLVDGTTNWAEWSANAEFTREIINEPTALSGKAIQWKWTKEGAYGGLFAIDFAKLVINEAYTISCWIKCSISKLIEVRWEGSSVAKRITVEQNVWTLFSYYFIFRGEVSDKIHFYFTSGSAPVETTMAVHSLKMERGTKPTDWSPAPEDFKNEIQIGGRNLLPKSKIPLTGTSYNIGNWYAATRDFIVGETLTATIKGYIHGSKLFGIWFDGGSHGGFPLTLVGERLYSAVFQVPIGTSNRSIGIYLRDNQANTDAWEFEWIKLESGNKRTDWSPAPEDVASDIDKAKDDAIDYVDGIQIGGSNLATGTADFDTVDGNIRSNYQAFGPNASFKFRGNVVKQITALWQGFRLLLEPTLSATIVSFYARVDAGGSASIKTIAGNLPNSFPNGNVINSLEWKQYYIYFPSGTQFSNASSQGIVEFADLVGKVYYSSVKVELGDKPTDWSPAPEDIANQAIKDAAGKYTTKSEFSTSITQLSNSIELKVAKTDFNALDIRVSTAETTITQHTSQIALKASNTDLTALGNRVSAAELKLTPVEINLAVKTQTENIAKAAAKRTEAVIDATALDPDKFYPTTIGLNAANSTPYTITVGRSLGGAYGVPGWSSHASGFSTECSWQTNGNGWGTAATNRIIFRFSFRFTAIPPMGTVGQMEFSNNEYIYVRGGSKYNVVVEGAADVPVTLHSETYSINGQSISPLTEIVTPVPDLSTKLAKTEFTAELTVLKDSIATKVSQTTFDQLGNTVSNHTTQLTQLPNTIDARITTQTSEGGIIKTNVESWFTMSGNTISLGAKTINISGATVFNSLATQTQAQGYAGDALNTAKGYTDTLQTTLGGMAFQDQVTLAKLDSTIIDGAYIKTTLIKASSITADKLDVDSVRAVVLTTESLQAVRIVTGNIEVTNNALVGGFKVSSYNLANVDNRDCWISVTCNDAYSKRVSSLGNNYPSSTGIATAGYFSATGNSRNHALILNATGSTENTDIWGGKSNLAIWATGGVKWRMNSGDHWCMPGVLGVFEIDGWSLAMQNRWGNGFSSLGISRGSDKAYAITHNIGHTEYTVLAIPFVTNTDGRWIESIPMYVDKSSTYIKIFFKTGSNDTTLPRYITFVFFGRNGV